MKQKKTIVIDTNVIFSAVYNIHSNAGKLILYGLEGKIQLIAPELAKNELQDALQKKLGFSVNEAQEFVDSLPIEWISESVYGPFLKETSRIIGGPDSHFVALALLTNSILVTADKEILRIKDINLSVSKLADLIEKLAKNKK